MFYYFIDRAHAQLRRLHNECSILKDAVITAIPSHCSKVMFKTCSKVKPTEVQNNGNNDNDEMLLTNISDEKMGFIMMECGFEGISFKVSFCVINQILHVYSNYVNFVIRLLKDQTLKKRTIEKLGMYLHPLQFLNLQLVKSHILKFVLKWKTILSQKQMVSIMIFN